MRREARHLLDKAASSLVLAIELFNRPHEGGRTDAVLILLDHAFEMLLKSAIVHRGGRIREKVPSRRSASIRAYAKGLATGDGRSSSLRTLNGYRDAAQHHLLARRFTTDVDSSRESSTHRTVDS